MQNGLALGLGVGKTPRKPPGGGAPAPTFRLLDRNGNTLTTRAGDRITYR